MSTHSELLSLCEFKGAFRKPLTDRKSRPPSRDHFVLLFFVEKMLLFKSSEIFVKINAVGSHKHPSRVSFSRHVFHTCCACGAAGFPPERGLIHRLQIKPPSRTRDQGLVCLSLTSSCLPRFSDLLDSDNQDKVLRKRFKQFNVEINGQILSRPPTRRHFLHDGASSAGASPRLETL